VCWTGGKRIAGCKESNFSKIVVFERVASCEDSVVVVRRSSVVVVRSPGERSIELTMQGDWPVFTGSTWSTAEDDPAADQLVYVGFHREGSFTGWVVDGSVRFDVAEATHGTVTVDLASRLPGDHVTGTIAFTVCR
jgi:hypothetical protein